MTIKLIAVGDNCLDVYLSKDRVAVGGNALNVGVQWRRMGHDARYFGVVGRDPEGEIVLSEVARVGLDPDDVELRPGSTAVTLLLENDGDRRFLLEDLGAGRDYLPSEDRHAALLGADWVHLGTNADPRLVRRLVAEGAGFSVDVSTAHDLLPLDGVPLVFASGAEDDGANDDDALQDFLQRGARKVVLTCGKRGAIYRDGTATHQIKARPITVVDTCGAGDSFIASFIAEAIVAGRPVPEALRLATGRAAETCTHQGGFPQTLRPIPEWLPRKYADVIATAES
ncbi:fructoselysine 6-kinase [Paracoccus suum]|uniref:Fructoselysine 6-kinase n=1 Tax=Paracoccus suum TaxID=2259340 RepID=A0A344PIM6_9RHOB|nr:PfkB family carbohydrate kinase [Paracoccus suum]AXC49231.1 fructoselysine 6-kinase [Paracoccus suum]